MPPVLRASSVFFRSGGQPDIMTDFSIIPARLRGLVALALCALLAACGSSRPVNTNPVVPTIDKQAHVPDFARKPYQAFARDDIVAMALREWRAWGENIDDQPEGSRPDLGENKPERQPGLWERVGEYWWLGQDADNNADSWTGKHDTFGTVFPPKQDGDYAWSAAFISYLMRMDGAGGRFPYSPSHSTYINIAAEMAKGTTQGWAITAQRPDSYAPQPGDLICHGRQAAKTLRFEDLPAGQFTSHCDIVVAQQAGSLAVIGGNVDDTVTLKHIPIDGAGRIAAPGDRVYDTRYPWMIVIQIQYDQ